MEEKTKEKILVVDDEQEICNVLKEFLAKKGYKVAAALSGEEAVKKVKQERPHMVLLDIKMPGMDGIEALKRIREIDKEIGIIMITAVNDDVVGQRCMELGAYNYITKPINFEYLETNLMIKLLDFAG